MAIDMQTNRADVATGTEGTATALVSGIVKDAQELFKQQVHLLQVEVEEDLRQTTQAAIALAIGLATALVGAILLSFAAVYLMDQWMPGRIWLWFSLVGAILASVGCVFITGAMTAFSKIKPTPEKSAEALQETLQWQTKPR